MLNKGSNLRQAEKFAGKKLLVLGSNAGSDAVIKYAQKNGAYVYVADNLPLVKSFAKPLADKAVLISTADMDALEQLVVNERINAVFSGVSEFNILRAMELADRCDLRFYCTRNQWDMIESKDAFRELCEKYAVPCPHTFFSGADTAAIPWKNITFPIVVKPVDCGASVGVHICQDKQAAVLAVEDAVDKSNSGRIIVEQFCGGREFTAHYVIHKGRAALSCIDNRYPVALHEGAVTTIPVARVYPSLFAREYIDSVNPQLLNLVDSLHLEEGVLFVQGLYDEAKKSFAVFEAGLRSAAECPFRFLESVTGLNYMKMIVDYLLLGSADEYDQAREDPLLGGKCCGVISFAGKHGVVASIEGLDRDYPGVLETELRYPVGSEVPDTDTLRQLAIRFVMTCENRADMARCVDEINGHVAMLDGNGNPLILPFDPKRLNGLE